MILEQQTYSKFNYLPSTLSSSSTKKIILSCDYCKNEFETTMKIRSVGFKKLPKDCCVNCKSKKREEIFFIKNGVKNPFQLNEVKEKIKQTNIEKYGVEHTFKSKEIQERSKKTCLERYGAENAMQNKEILEKQKKSLESNYGVANPSQCASIQEKIRNTNNEKYGCDYYVASEDCKNKVRDKFGVDNVFELDEVKVKIQKTNMIRYGVDHPMKSPEIAKIAKQKEIETKKELGQIKIYENKTAPEWSKELGFSKSHFNTLVNKYGWERAVKMTPKISSLEEKLKIILENNQIEYQTQVAINKYYCDFTIGKIAIECWGNFWHSEHQKNKDYHIEKQKSYIANGYTPLSFTEDEIENKIHIVESIILNKLNKSKKYHARKCVIKLVDKNEAKIFFENNHLMGKGRGDTLGLYYDDELLTCLQICPIYNKEYEISRFAHKCGINVIGGFSKLLKYFEKQYDPTGLITFTDLRYGSGSYLADLGFTKRSEFASFRWTNGRVALHRMKFISNTGYNFGFYKIWDCGQAKWKKVYN